MSVVAAAALALALTACGDDNVSDDPEGALSDAVSALADWDGMTLEVSFQADDTARSSILADAPDDEEILDLVLGASLRVTTVADDGSEQQTMTVNLDGTDVFELYASTTEATIDDLALRVDLPAILEHVDDPTAQQQLDEMLAMAGMFGLQDAAQAMNDGEWIAVTGFDGLMNMVEGLAPPSDEEEPDQDQIEEARTQLAERAQRFIDEDATVTYVDSEDAGERVRVEASGPELQRFVDDVMQILLANDLLEDLGTDDLDMMVEDIPDDAEVSFDAWIEGGELRQVAIDLASVEESEIDGEFMVVVALENHTGGLSAPDAATTVDVMSLMGQAMGGAMSFDDLGTDDELGADDGSDTGTDELGADDGSDLGADLEGDLGDLGADMELSDEDIQMMIEFMPCVTDEDIQGFEMFMPELAEAIDEALADGSLERC